jgi:hypothetical protein
LAAVVPVAVATMTPLPLLAALCLLKIRKWAMGDCGQISDGDNNEEFKHTESNQKLMLGNEECDS